MGNQNSKPKITVEALLELKRHERPGNQFWDTFERDFQRRRLNALVARPSWRDALWHYTVRSLAFSVPVLLLAGLAMLWSRHTVTVHQDSIAAREAPPIELGEFVAQQEPVREVVRWMATERANLASSQFVLDAIEPSASSATAFRKVLYTPAIRLSAPSGAFYVKDNLSSSNFQVTTADLKLGRNF